ncbi:MAG: hypothetical protein ACOY3Y_07660 [Acidobacteriota bacterium]
MTLPEQAPARRHETATEKPAERGRFASVMRAYVVFGLLVSLKVVSRIFYRFRLRWEGPAPKSWSDVRILSALNHTSLYEPIYAGALPLGLLWRIARYGVVPVAEKTMRRPGIGLFFKMIAQNVVHVTRQPDQTWKAVLDRIGPDSLVVLFPEGRMKRPDGLDGDGKPMTVRGGIADVIEAAGGGRMLVAYLGGLHHIQAPGQFLPRAFHRVKLTLELLDVAWYREIMLHRGGEEGFKKAVIADLQERRDRYCPPGPRESLSLLTRQTAPRVTDSGSTPRPDDRT